MLTQENIHKSGVNGSHNSYEPVKPPAELSPALKAVSEIDGMDVEAALKRLMGKQSILERSLKMVGASVGDKIEQMSSYLDENMLGEFAFGMHGLKGSLGTVGATKRAEVAASLETAAKKGDFDYVKCNFNQFANDILHLVSRLNDISGNYGL